MQKLFTLDAEKLFAPKLTLAEVAVSGCVLFAGLMVLLRLIPKRQVSNTSMTDVMFVVLVGGLTVEALAKNAESLTDYLLMLVTVMLLAFASDVLSYRLVWFRRLVQESPTCLVRDGEVQHDGLKKEMMTEEDLARELRRQGFEDVADVKQMLLEADGEVSVLEKQVRSNPNEAEEEPSPTDDEGDGTEEVEAFLAAAEKLRAKLAWHEGRIAAIRAALAGRGVRFRSPEADLK